MPLPLAPIALFALRGTAVAAAVWAVRRGMRAVAAPGRTDQRSEDAMDDLSDGFATHSVTIHGDDGPEARQSNAAGRARRTIRWAGREMELDAAFVARLRLRPK